jgi:hypothetical protein
MSEIKYEYEIRRGAVPEHEFSCRECGFKAKPGKWKHPLVAKTGPEECRWPECPECGRPWDGDFREMEDDEEPLVPF